LEKLCSKLLLKNDFPYPRKSDLQQSGKFNEKRLLHKFKSLEAEDNEAIVKQVMFKKIVFQLSIDIKEFLLFIKILYFNLLIENNNEMQFTFSPLSVEFDNFMQQDAHEFLNFLINHINEIIAGDKKI
jgi:hypothetical protein